MMITLDLNILLDIIQHRKYHYVSSAEVVQKVIEHEIEGAIPAHSISTIFYIVSKYRDHKTANKALDWLLAHFQVITLDRAALVRARELSFKDFEDAVVASLAESIQSKFIITRNVNDFKNAPVPVLTPDEFLAQLL